jgi:hypothetical protein
MLAYKDFLRACSSTIFARSLVIEAVGQIDEPIASELPV